eukprot:14850453-Alexandrium_andersonii.AAC.1
MHVNSIGCALMTLMVLHPSAPANQNPWPPPGHMYMHTCWDILNAMLCYHSTCSITPPPMHLQCICARVGLAQRACFTRSVQRALPHKHAREVGGAVEDGVLVDPRHPWQRAPEQALNVLANRERDA